MTAAEPATPPAESVPERRTPPARTIPRTYPPGPAEPVMSGKLPSGLDFDADAQGLDPDFITGRFDKHGYTEIDHHAWMRACAEGAFIGTCRRCGAYLLPRRPREHDGAFEYEGYCRRASESMYNALTGVRTVSGCGWEFAAPRGRVHLGSSSRSKRSAALSKKAHAASSASDTSSQTAF